MYSLDTSELEPGSYTLEGRWAIDGIPGATGGTERSSFVVVTDSTELPDA